MPFRATADVEREPTDPPAKYSRQPRGRRAGGSRSSRGRPRGRLRGFYFGLASLWGFLSGTAAVFVALRAIDRPLQMQQPVPLLLAGAGLVALLGGLVAAAAYREATHRQ